MQKSDHPAKVGPQPGSSLAFTGSIPQGSASNSTGLCEEKLLLFGNYTNLPKEGPRNQREYTDATPAALVDEIGSLSDPLVKNDRGRSLTTMLRGKWISTAGVMTGFYLYESEVAVEIHGRILCHFDRAQWASRLMTSCRRGDVLETDGQIDSVDARYMNLVRCELRSAEDRK